LKERSKFFVKIRDLDANHKGYDLVGSFDDKLEAELCKDKLMSGSGGLFGLYYQVWVDTNTPILRRTNVTKPGQRKSIKKRTG
jgi:hypothetical protein